MPAPRNSPPAPAGLTVRIWDNSKSLSKPMLKITGCTAVPHRGDLMRNLPWRSAVRVEDVSWDLPAGTVDVYVR